MQPTSRRPQDEQSPLAPQQDPQREYKDKLAAAQVDRVKVIGLDKLRKKYVEYEAKRNLCGGHDLFLAHGLGWQEWTRPHAWPHTRQPQPV